LYTVHAYTYTSWDPCMATTTPALMERGIIAYYESIPLIHPTQKPWSLTCLLPIHIQCLIVDQFKAFKANSGIESLKIVASGMHTISRYYVGWMRGTFVHDKSFSPALTTFPALEIIHLSPLKKFPSTQSYIYYMDSLTKLVMAT
jgi:hypothetical protein